jgi:hypothetical protein
MAYNLGQTRPTKFTSMLAAIAASDFDKALKEMRTSLWAKRLGERAARWAEIVRNGWRDSGRSVKDAPKSELTYAEEKESDTRVVVEGRSENSQDDGEAKEGPR